MKRQTDSTYIKESSRDYLGALLTKLFTSSFYLSHSVIQVLLDTTYQNLNDRSCLLSHCQLESFHLNQAYILSADWFLFLQLDFQVLNFVFQLLNFCSYYWISL